MLTWTVAVTSLSALGLSHLMSIFNTMCQVTLLICSPPPTAAHLTVKSNVLLMSCKFGHANHNHFPPSLSSSTLIQRFPKYTKSFPPPHMPFLLQRTFLPKMTCMIPSFILFKPLFKYHLSSEVFPDHLL